jgi:hypothetical protein
MRDSRAKKKVGATSQLILPRSPATLCPLLARFKRTLAAMPVGLRGANLREAFRHL